MLLKTDIEILPLRKHQAGQVQYSSQPGGNLPLYPFVQYTPERQASKREEAIPCIDGVRNTPEFPKCRTVAAFGIAIFDIIMNERKVMGQFDSRRRGQRSAQILR